MTAKKLNGEVEREAGKMKRDSSSLRSAL